MVGKLPVGADSAEFLGHTHMRLINPHTLFRLRDRALMGPLILLWWVPKHTIVEESILVLHLIRSPCRVPVHPFPVGALHLDLVLRIVRDPWSAISVGLDSGGETSEFIFIASKFTSVPIVELSEDGESLGLRGPLLEFDVSVALEAEAVALVACTSSNVHETSLSVLKDFEPSKDINSIKMTLTSCIREFSASDRSHVATGMDHLRAPTVYYCQGLQSPYA
jgi:hypothetical protein